MQNQIKQKIWNPRKIHLTPLKCSHPRQIVPSGSGLAASQMVQRTLKMVPLPPRGPPSIIGKHWVPYLEQKGHLADCKPKDFSYKDGWLPLYTRAGITKHLSGLESLLNKDKTSPLIAVILPKMDFQYEREYVVHKLHKSESFNGTAFPRSSEGNQLT